jgi:lipopolysaccharide export system permease protein
MPKLDKYILKKFLVTFLFCMLLFTVVAVAVDTSEKADNFVKSKLDTMGLIKNYYLGFVPWIWSMLYPLFVFIAVIFFTSRMASRSEIIAVLASGTSYNRFLRPYVIGGILLGAVLWIGARYWIPKANHIRSSFQSRYVDIENRTRSGEEVCRGCFYLRIDTNTFVGLREYDTSSKTGRNFSLNKVKANKVVYNLRAESIQWDTVAKRWKLNNAAERVVDSIGEKLTYHTTLLKVMPLKPSELIKDQYIKDQLTTPDLVAFIKREEVRGSEGLSALKVERYRRTATSAAVLLLTIIGAVIASRKTRGGSGVHLALGIIIGALFVVSDRFSTVFATKSDLPPLIAAWLPNFVFSFVAIYFYRRAPK